MCAVKQHKDNGSNGGEDNGAQGASLDRNSARYAAGASR